MDTNGLTEITDVQAKILEGHEGYGYPYDMYNIRMGEEK
jgi:hypothetical protein